MLANGILNSSSSETMKRWDCSNVDQETVKMFLGERIRFPYASNLSVRNRIMKSAMSEQLATYDKNDMTKSGIPTEELIHLYEKFADGGYGIIVTGCIMINGKNIEAPGNVIIDKQLDCEERRNAFEKWTECAKRNGSIIIAQLFHPGNCAADLPHKTDFNINKLMRNEISEFINEYAYAASYAQQCGFNGVEISCSYFFALGQLITSGRNNRNDEFGGSLDNRTKILFKIIQAIRMKIRKPSSFVIGLKLFCGNFEPDYDNDAFAAFVYNVEKTGFDYIVITGGHYNLIKDLKHDDDPKKCEYFYQKFVLTMKKQLTRTKLFMNGGFVTLPEMIAAIRDGWAAGISLARPVAAEPDLPNKLFAGEVKSAVQSLFEPSDYSIEVKFAGTQLWQHGCLLNVMDASNPDHIEQFKKDLHLHEKQNLVASSDDGNAEFIIGYPKTIVNPELLDKDMLKRIQQPSKETNITTLDKHEEESELKTTKIDDDTENVMVEEKTHYFMTKESDYGSSGNMKENIVEDSIHKVIKQNENFSDNGMDVIEETIEKVISTQSDLSEPSQVKLVESSQQEVKIGDDVIEAQNDEIISHNDGVLNAASETPLLDATTFREDVKVVDKMIKDATEENEYEEINEEPCKKVLYPKEESEISETAELISGLSNDDKPIISGIVEEFSSGKDDTMQSMEYDAKQENIENLANENVKQPINGEESFVGSKNHATNENAMEGIMNKETYDVPPEMVTSFIGDSMKHQIEMWLGEGDEDISKFQDMGQYSEIAKDNDKEQDDIADAHAPEEVTEAYISKNVTEDHLSESMDERFSKVTSDMEGDLTDNHFQQNVGHDMKDDLQSETTLSKDAATDNRNQEYYYNTEDFTGGKIEQAGWNELSGETDHYKISSPTYDTLLGSTLMSGHDGSVVYEEYYDKQSDTVHSPEETYHSEIYGTPVSESKDAKNAENLPSKTTDISQAEPEFDTCKPIPDNKSTDKQKLGLAGFISSSLPDSVQNLISSTKMKFGEMLGEDDRKQQLDSQFTMKTEEIIDDGNKYNIHTESSTVSGTDYKSSSDFGDTKTYLVDDSDKFIIHDDDPAESTVSYSSFYQNYRNKNDNFE